MESQPKSFPAKLLLFGEYGILLGSKALIMPYNSYFGCLAFRVTVSDSVLMSLLGYLQKKNNAFKTLLDLQAFEHDISKGLFFESNIPRNYGLGSSGALIAALFARYGKFNADWNAENVKFLRTDLALAESFFHGKSSGVDPLVSFLQTPLLIDKEFKVCLKEQFTLPNGGNSGFFLLDSRQTGKTGDLVSGFMNRLKDYRFTTSFMKAYSSFSDKAIESLLAENWDDFGNYLAQLSQFQLNFMSELIPAPIQTIYNRGLANGKFYIKLCGSGGGGMFLGFTTDVPYVKQTLEHVVFI